MAVQFLLALVDRYLDECDRSVGTANVQSLSLRLCLTPRELTQRSLRMTGLPPGDLLRNRQLARARDFLLDTDLTVEVIAMHCGFGCERTLYRLFSEAEGMTPNEFRRRHREQERSDLR